MDDLHNVNSDLDLSMLSVDQLYTIAVDHLNESSPFFRENPYVLRHIYAEATIEQTGAQIDKPPGVVFFQSPRFWKNFKDEFHLLLCTKDKKYAELRNALSKSTDRSSQLAIVSTISAAVAGSLGVVAGSVVPICAICLIGTLKMGKEAFCSGKSLNVKVSPD